MDVVQRHRAVEVVELGVGVRGQRLGEVGLRRSEFALVVDHRELVEPAAAVVVGVEVG